MEKFNVNIDDSIQQYVALNCPDSCGHSFTFSDDSVHFSIPWGQPRSPRLIQCAAKLLYNCVNPWNFHHEVGDFNEWTQIRDYNGTVHQFYGRLCSIDNEIIADDRIGEKWNLVCCCCVEASVKIANYRCLYLYIYYIFQKFSLLMMMMITFYHVAPSYTAMVNGKSKPPAVGLDGLALLGHCLDRYGPAAQP